MKKKMIAVFAVVVASMFVTSPAMADDATTPEVAAEVVAPEVAPEPVAAAPEPVVEEAAPRPTPEPVVAKTKTDTETEKPWICHPVNGKGETGNGWNLINPNKASSHIDDEGNPKHESNDGRVDTPAINGECPSVEEPPAFEKYEVKVCWVMDNSDGIEGTYEWPQTRGSCHPVPECEEVIEIQKDYYWIENKDDEDYLAGLTVLNSPADDAQLSPHNYSSKVFTGEDCPPPPYDECPLIEGNQPEGTDCDPVVPPVDVCPEIEGDQPEGTDCNPVVPPTEEPPTVEPPTVEPPAATPVLPDTGASDNLLLLLLVGAGLVAMGGGVTVAARRN